MDNINKRTKTIFCDIDGTLWKHIGPPSKQLIDKMELLPNTIQAIETWEKLGYKIILTTGRKESMRDITKKRLEELGIIYDHLLMGLGNGDRILINDKKTDSTRNTAYAINVNRNSGITNFNFHHNNVVINDEQPNEVIKPWGQENLIEFNDKYVVKKLLMKQGECCSMQYHELKKETIYVVNGELKVYIGKNIDKLEEKILKPNDFITIEPFTIHRMEGNTDCTYIECSTSELWDVIRLQDKYKRENTTEQDYRN